MDASAEYLHLTSNFTRAVDYARQVHINYRKGTNVPYMAHLLGVASLVMGECGHVPFAVTEDVVIAALLHDSVEDEGGLPRLGDIEANFGKEAATIVKGCSDTFAEESSRKQLWEERKAAYVKRLWDEPQTTLLVSLADKVYNARSILEDYREIGSEVWKRFKRGHKEQIWYFDELLKVFTTWKVRRLADRRRVEADR